MINYMRYVQNKTTDAIKRPKPSNETSNQTSEQTSPKRVMTTMSPSTKDKLKRNLKTFAASRPRSVFKEKELPPEPPSILEMPLPNYTKNAYQYTRVENLDIAPAKTHNKTATSLSKSKVLPEMKVNQLAKRRPAFNDETLLFRANASKPLVNQTR